MESYFTNLDFPETRGIPLLIHHLGQIGRVRSRANLTRMPSQVLPVQSRYASCTASFAWPWRMEHLNRWDTRPPGHAVRWRRFGWQTFSGLRSKVLWLRSKVEETFTTPISIFFWAQRGVEERGREREREREKKKKYMYIYMYISIY